MRTDLSPLPPQQTSIILSLSSSSSSSNSYIKERNKSLITLQFLINQYLYSNTLGHIYLYGANLYATKLEIHTKKPSSKNKV